MNNNFITNSGENTSLKKRLEKLTSASKELKFLVGFFYFSGWKEIYRNLKNNENITLKVLVGLQVDKYLSGIVEHGHQDTKQSNDEYFAQFISSLGNAINNAEMDNEEFFNQVHFFVKLIEEKRLIIRKTVNPNHAKLYLFHLEDEYKDLFNVKGEFITGSSNLTKAGLQEQNEFNVEIRDYGFDSAEKYFDDLWRESIPITERPNGIKIIIDAINNKSQAAYITPYEAYALILKTYIELQEVKTIDDSVIRLLEENGFEKYKYQLDAVNQALSVIETYNGVIIADVVGLGKSVIASLIASQLGKRGVIISPPGLIGNKRENTGWWGYLNSFKLYNWDIESSGNLESLAESIQSNKLNYEVVIVDEAHRFRNQDTAAYEALMDICRGKIVILLTATPFNNSPADIFSLLKLFIVPGESGITIESDLENRFRAYNYRFKRLSNIMKNHKSTKKDNKQRAESDYTKMFGMPLPIDMKLVKNNAAQMAKNIKNVITPVVIRRNRLDLMEDFEYKKEIEDLSIVDDPKEQFFELTPAQLDFYDRIIKDYFVEDGRFKGAIYKPFEYEQNTNKDKKLNDEDNRTFQQQRNLHDFMRRLLVKRFESSFGAFEKSIHRFLRVNKMVLAFIEKSGKYILDRKVIEGIYNEDEDADSFTMNAIKEALEEFESNATNKTQPKNTKIYNIDEFDYKDNFISDIKNDIKLFEEINDEIKELNLINEDPKRKTVLDTIKKELSKGTNPKRKVVLFTEYTDTVVHLQEYFKEELSGRVIFCDGNLTKTLSLELEANFNTKANVTADDYDVLVTSDKLSEGYNLNRAGLVINYDIPWNPTRVIQRVGRINRMSDKVFDHLFIYNFFPTERGAGIVKSREIAQQKMFLIHNALGEDAKIFDVDEEPTPSGLFKKLGENPEDKEGISTSTQIRNEYNNIVINHPEIIDRISALPNRTKTAKSFNENNVAVIRKKGMALFTVIHRYDEEKPTEKTFIDFLNYVKCEKDEERLPFTPNFWKSYNEIKEFAPKDGTSTSDLALETQANAGLKSLLKSGDRDLDQELTSFIYTLLNDIRKYKTLPKYTLRQLKLPDGKNRKDGIKELISNVKQLRRKLGDDYLEVILSRVKKIDDDVIVAVANYKKR